MMELLRGLADHERAVVVVTHATKSLGMCSRIIVMGRGGRLCFDGPPDEAKVFFNAETFDDIYAQLDRRPSEEWQRKLAQERAQPVVAEQPAATAPAESAKAGRQRGSLVRQAFVLTHRYVTLFSRDRRNLIILLAQVPLLALAIVGLYKSGIFSSKRDADDAVTVGFLVVTIVVWFGSIDGAREIIKEKTVYTRAAAVGVRTGAYLISKAVVLFTLASLQTLVLLAIFFFFQPLHEATSAYITVTFVLILTAVASERINRNPEYAAVSKFGKDYFAIDPIRVELALVVSFAGVFFLLRRDRP